MTDSKQSVFNQMHIGQQTPDDPGYLRYWQDRAENNPEDERLARIVNGLTHVALRGEQIEAEYTDREPALQARYWYRALGPLNPLTDVEPDMIRAAELMHEQRTVKEEESANLQLDSAYILSELARVSTSSQTRPVALSLALETTRAISQNNRFAERDASYRLQTSILEQDLLHDALRLRFAGTLEPSALSTDVYRKYEKAYVGQELLAIESFGKLVKEGITEENFGIVFEWYFLMARRHQAWSDEEIDKTLVRGATSRENAEWTGEDVVNPTRPSSNHDIVIHTMQPDGKVRQELLQLKAVKGSRRYHPRVKVIDFEEALRHQFKNIDSATSHLVQNLVKFREDYRNAYSET